MAQVLEAFTNNLLPILLISAAGFWLGKAFSLDGRTLGRVIFYLLSPALVFKLLVYNALPPERLAWMMAFSAATILTVGGIAYLAGRILHLRGTLLTAVVLTTLLANHGNYGLPLVSFAFGPEALTYASVYFITGSLLTNTIGIVVASLGHYSPKEALLGFFKVPAIYGILAAFLVGQTGWSPPLPLERTLNLLAEAAIPAMIILLGLELQQVQWGQHLGVIGLVAALRLVIGPLVAIWLASLFHLPPAARQAGIIEAGMPSAVMNTVLASEYKIEPPLVTAIIFASTLLSPLTLTPLLVFLGK